MKFIKPDKWYPNMKSETITLFTIKNTKVTLDEYYNPHFLYVNIWKRDTEEDLFVLKKWIHTPLNRYARQIHKLAKKEIGEK